MPYNTSIKEAAKLLGISPQGVHKRIANGSLEARKVYNHWAVNSESLAESLASKPKPGRKRKGEDCLLMNRNHPVMIFSYDDGDNSFVPRSVIDATRAPIGTVTRNGKGNAQGLKRWWEHRCIPESRVNMDKKLAALGVRNASQIPFRNLGFSLSDQYWIQPADENLSWENLNYFNNSFGNKEAVWDDWLNEIGLDSPDNTSEGALPKKWVCENGQRILLKGHNPWTDQQVYNEKAATALHRRILDVHDFVPYEIRTAGALGVVCTCPCFLHDDEEYIPASLIDETETTFRGETAYASFMRKAKNLGIAQADIELAVAKMIVSDFLLANTDRHLRNFGFIRNVETLEWRMAPLFDSGNSLWFDKDESAVAKGDYAFTSRPFDENPLRQLMLASHNVWFELDLLDGFAEEAVGILSEGNISRWRADYLEAGINRNIEILKNALCS